MRRSVPLLGAIVLVSLSGCFELMRKSNQEAFMTRSESEKELASRRHSDHWARVLAEREAKQKAEAERVARDRARTVVPVAVFDLDGTDSGLEPGTIDALSEYVAMRLASTRSYRVVPRAELRALIEQQQAESYRACYDERCQIELGKAIAASKSLSPKLLRAGDRCVLGAVLYDLTTAAAEKSASVRTPCSPEAMLDGVDALVADLDR